MAAAIAADAVLIIHLCFILFVMLGGVLVLKRRKFIYLHIPALCWGIFVELSGHICPLTAIEQHLRIAAGQHGYPGGFIDHYLVAIIYPEGLTRTIQTAIGVGLISVNILLYGLVIYRAGLQRAAKN